jgi:NAD(P)-dependent dehydrogenase (short-subunit alcohol dehydrogenase family)
MALPQRGTGSGFGGQSTAAEVVNGIDLAGKLAIVTGGYSGLGLAATRALAGAGAHVVVPARRPAVAADALNGIDGVETGELDLADLDSVRVFAARFLASGRRVHIVISSAGIMACPETRVGPGWEAQFAINHLGHYALVNLLWPALARGHAARVVALSSGLDESSQIHWDDVHFERGYDKWQAYIQAKKANALFAAWLDGLGRDSGVRAFSVNPGYILTPLQRHLTKAEMLAAGWINEDGTAAMPVFKTPEQGAATQVWAATSPQLAGVGGVYCADCDIAEIPDGFYDGAERLWDLSAGLTGINAFGLAS